MIINALCTTRDCPLSMLRWSFVVSPRGPTRDQFQQLDLLEQFLDLITLTKFVSEKVLESSHRSSSVLLPIAAPCPSRRRARSCDG